MQELKRKVATGIALLPFASLLAACKATAMRQTPKDTQQQRFKNMGLTLVVDAIDGAEMLGTEFFADDRDRPFYTSSTTRKGNRSIMAFPSGTVPERVKVMWRDSNKIVGRRDNPTISTYDGKVLGDYTLLLASRIPDEVVEETRNNGGGLRLKFRLKPDGVMFGWDIERFSGGLPRHTMPGGIF